MHSVNSTQSRENKKNPVAKCYPYWEVNLGPLTLLPCMLLSELIPLSQTFVSLYIHALLIFAIRHVKEYGGGAEISSNIGELAQIVAL